MTLVLEGQRIFKRESFFMSREELQEIFAKNFGSQNETIVGTLFLDEISDANIDVQNFILSALNKRESGEKGYKDLKLLVLPDKTLRKR